MTKSPHLSTKRGTTLNFTSHHHPRVFAGRIRCLNNRADRICSSRKEEKEEEKEVKHSEKNFTANSYPKDLVKVSLHRTNENRNTEDTVKPPKTRTKTSLLPPLCKGPIGRDPMKMQENQHQNSVQILQHH